MIPVNGFFEYGIAALLGAFSMIGLSVWALISDDSREKGEQSEKNDPKSSVPGPISYKKAA